VNHTRNRCWDKYIYWSLSLTLVLCVLLGGGSASATDRPANTLELGEVGGKVSLPDGTGVAGVRVAASGRTTIRNAADRSTTTARDGSYRMRLPVGDYALSIQPAQITNVSPEWVVTTAPVPLRVAANSSTTQDFTVQPATVTVQGQLQFPTTGRDLATERTPILAWVRAENREGQGNTVTVGSDGRFRIKVLAGGVNLSIALPNPRWSMDSASLSYTAEAGATIEVQPKPLIVTERGGSLSGVVTVLGEQRELAPAGVPVRAWRTDGVGVVRTTTDVSGTYRLNVSAGVWLVQAMPVDTENYAVYGNPYDPAMFVPAQEAQRVRVDGTTPAAQNLQIARVDTMVRGSAVDSRTGAPLGAGVNGHAYVLYRNNEGRLVRANGAPLRDGTFELGLSSLVTTSYRAGLYFAPNAGYEALASVPFSLTASTPISLSIPVLVNNSQITGTLSTADGTPVTGVRGRVLALSNFGGTAFTLLDPRTGSYQLNVGTTDVRGQSGTKWRVSIQLDPRSGYVLNRPRVQTAFLPYNDGAGSRVTVPFTASQVSALIKGRIVLPTPDRLAYASDDPDARLQTLLNPAAGVRVVVREVGSDVAGAYTNWGFTDRDGNFSVRVAAGEYRVSVHTRPLRDLRRLRTLIAPAPVTVQVADGATVATPDLPFRLPDAPVTGQVTFDATGTPALVRARAADGATVQAFTDLRGNYQLDLLGGVRWSVIATSANNDGFLKSQREVFTPTVSTSPQPVSFTLELVERERMPRSTTFTFDAAESQDLRLANGSGIQVPAGALGVSGTVLLVARPLPQLASDHDLEPIAFGYRLHAFGEDGRPITQFLAPVTLLIPFTAEQVQALGTTNARLIPAYWDEPSASWKSVDHVSIISDDQGGGVVQVVVDHFTDYALVTPAEIEPARQPSGVQVYLPLVVRR